MTIRVRCSVEPEHYHEYPDNWTFGGASGTDPRADPRWRPSVYEYYDDQARRLHTTSAPLCEDQAIDEFTTVAGWGRSYNPVWLAVKRPDEGFVMLPWVYDKREDLVTPHESA